MAALGEAIDAVAASTGFSGVVRVDRGGDVELASAYGAARRDCEIAISFDTQFGIASGTKSLTAVASLVEDGTLELSTTGRSALGDEQRRAPGVEALRPRLLAARVATS